MAALKKAENAVKVGGDKSSAVIKSLIGAVAVLIGILITLYIVRQISRPVLRNLSLAQRIASGDLTAIIQSDSNDELGKLTAAMAVVQTAASMEQLTSTVKNNTENARHASQIAFDAAQNAHKGGEVVQNVVKTMDDIAASAKKIADITTVINSIAFQTNILALNAAVEAVRAGEQGRGFAVIAGEVRALSQRSSQAAKDIALLISESVEHTDLGSALVAQAGKTMENIVNSVARVNDIMEEISSASEEQSRGIEQISRAITELDSTTQQNATLVSESSSSANTLEEQAVLLEHLVANFRLNEATAVTQENARLR